MGTGRIKLQEKWRRNKSSEWHHLFDYSLSADVTFCHLFHWTGLPLPVWHTFWMSSKHKYNFLCHLETEALPDCGYFNNDENLTIYSWERIDVKQTFSICLNANVSENLICKKCPLRMNENTTFMIHQGHCCVKYLFDLQADNFGGTFTRKNQGHFYKAVRNDSKEISLSSEAHAQKENGKVISGKINSKVSGRWE